jgi:hypothetical protein
MKNFRYFRLAGFLFLALLFPHCGGSKVEKQSTPAPTSGLNEGTLGVRNFVQQRATLSLVTGVDPSDPKISNYFEKAKTRLSADGAAEKISASHLLASTALTGVFCDRFIERESLLKPGERRAHASVSFGESSSKFRPEDRKAVVKRYAELFWRRAPTAAETEELVQLMAGIEAETGDAKRQLFDMLLAACTVVGSSLDALRI